MVSKGELVQFKPGTFGINSPKNFAIYISSKKMKRGVLVKLLTIHGVRETKRVNLYKASYGESVQLVNNHLPPEKELRARLNQWIKGMASRKAKEASEAERLGELNERGLWMKAIEVAKADPEKSGGSSADQSALDFSTMELARIWYESDEISKSKLKKVSELLKSCNSPGVGYFDPLPMKRWLLVSEQERKDVSRGITVLGSIRSKMFQMVEEPIEEDSEEMQVVRRPVEWSAVDLDEEESATFARMQEIMVYYVEFDNWPKTNLLGGTRISALDGFALFSFLTYLAEDWVDEGRTTRADSFVKMLIRTGYLGDDEALLKIAQRAINLSPDFDWDTSEEIEELALKYGEPSETPEVFKDRLDLQEIEAYTIDPPTAKDFDDAVSVIEEDGGYTLWVHIADVAHYVEMHTKLDMHASRRSTSVYLPNRVLPMLPHHLSDNLCSLREKVPRLAMSVKIRYDKSGKRIEGSEEVFNSVINVRENLSYDFVNVEIDKKSEPYYTYYTLAQLINGHRRSLHLETPEVKLHLGQEMSISTKEATPSTKMIETFMVAANEAIGEIFFRAKIPGIYRCHPLPEEDNVLKFNGQSKVLELPYNIELPEDEDEEEEEEGESLLSKLKSGGGVVSFTIGGGSSFADFMDPDDEDEEESVDLGTPLTKGIAQMSPEFQDRYLQPFIDVLSGIEAMDWDKELQRIAYLSVLGMFPLAFYTAANIGHFGLGSVRYVHFTSPIRRYPDVIAHRVCKELISKGAHSGDGAEDAEPPYTVEEIEQMADHSSEQTVLASRLERQIVSAGFSFLAKNQSFEQRQGIVSRVNSSGVYVLLPNGVEARVSLNDLTNRPTFVDDFESMCFVGSKGRFNLNEEVTPFNYKELMTEGDELAEVLVKIGDKMVIEFSKLDHVEGRIQGRAVRIFKRIPEGYSEGEEIILEEE